MGYPHYTGDSDENRVCFSVDRQPSGGTTHMASILQRVVAEYARANDKGYDDEHDDEHGLGHLFMTAARYMNQAGQDPTWSGREAALLKAAVLLVAALRYVDRHDGEAALQGRGTEAPRVWWGSPQPAGEEKFTWAVKRRGGVPKYVRMTVGDADRVWGILSRVDSSYFVARVEEAEWGEAELDDMEAQVEEVVDGRDYGEIGARAVSRGKAALTQRFGVHCG
jgi:hypothetical protein